MANVVIGIADMNVTQSPDTLITLGLGSCVGLVLYDKASKIGGMVHIMLPVSRDAVSNKAKYADTGVGYLYSRMIRYGANRKTMIAKLAGGAHMFGVSGNNDVMKVGEKNIEICHRLLNEYGIPIKGEETGGNIGRTLEFCCETGNLKIRTAWPRTEKII